MLNKGTTHTEYEPYGYNIPITINENISNIYLKEPLRGIGDYKDYIDVGNQKIVRKIKKIRLTSALNWTTEQNSNGNYYHYCNIGDILKTASDKSILCNAYTTTTQNTTEVDNTICYNLNMDGFVVMNNSYTTVEDFNNYLDGNEIYVEYPTDQSENSLELPTLSLKNGTNVITVNTETLPSNIELKYYEINN